jgi:hypothetical protein
VTCQVLFLNTLYYPSIQELERLENIQREISGWRAELLKGQQARKYSMGEIYLSKQKFHQGIRDNWKIFKGFKEDFIKTLEYKSEL